MLPGGPLTLRASDTRTLGKTIMGGRIYPDADPQATIVWSLPFSLATTRCTPLYIGNDFAFVLCNIKATLINIVRLHQFTKEIQACYSAPIFAKKSWIVTGLTALART